jgi:hypothetical protein
MKLEEWRKENKLSYYNLGLKLGLVGVQNPGTSVQRWSLTSKIKRFPNPEMVKKIVEITKGKVKIGDLYEAWYQAKV